MSTMTDGAPELRANDVIVTDENLIVQLEDGRAIMVPLWWFPMLARGSRKQRENWRLTFGGYAITWDELDEDLSVRGLLSERSRPAPIPKSLRGEDAARQHVGQRADAASTRWQDRSIEEAQNQLPRRKRLKDET